ncbi:hypothetical protein PsYK624_041200 [Phanerochaete sordida]|uniref:Uncharacterized protein n=1 Tax=Phanerochaete sordida TaxID=48140 RepID=A0A9P3G4N4_9APHY|nr:hypothetical protein PsYK624_041200 [Phanerochaete sordida]
MSDSIIPDADVPIFEGRTPWLAVPTIAIFAVCVAYRPKKAIFAPEGSTVAKRMHGVKWLLLGMQLLNVLCAFGVYSHHDGPPLTLGLPASAISDDKDGALFPVAAALCAAALASYAQIGMAGMYVYVSGQHARAWILLAVVTFSSICAPGWIIGSLIALIEGFLPDRLVIQEIKWMMIGQVFTPLGDVIMSVALSRLHQQAGPDKKPLLLKLYGIVSFTQGTTILLMNLSLLGEVLGLMPDNGLLSNTLHICGSLIASQLHLVALFLMWHVAQGRLDRAPVGDHNSEDDAAESKAALALGVV